MQNQAQLREMASDLLRDAPIETLRAMLHRIGRSEFQATKRLTMKLRVW